MIEQLEWDIEWSQIRIAWHRSHAIISGDVTVLISCAQVTILKYIIAEIKTEVVLNFISLLKKSTKN